ncbi:MAG: hypothetical protein M1354_02655 [Candidatus Marsarchaeota archaeon]|jgi:alcohol dehydrogenase class IV|nr:hypothetical protein [Candidatus Marsarchaeota archaeon]
MTGEIPDEFWGIMIKRYEKMPSHISIAIGGGESIDKKKAIEALKKRDGTGVLLAKIELRYLELFKDEAQWKRV